MNPETKKCPYCDEEISVNAIKCKHCGSMLTNEGQPTERINADTKVKIALAGKYEIIREVGKGGMATVYEAIQKNLNRKVALKVIHFNLIHDEEFLSRFHREAQVAASLDHPNIVTVHDEGHIGDIHYMSMQFLEGKDLHTIIKEKGKLTAEETVRYITPVAEALDYAHKREVIHRDIKSSNIIITSEGRPVLTDFGIAHAASGTKLTQTGSIIGTPEYMSPEQAEGKEIDHRSDLYSLGVVMYECLTGKVPFKGDNPITVIHNIVHIEPNFDELNKDQSEGISSIIKRCIFKEKSKRIQNARDLTIELKSYPKIVNKIDSSFVAIQQIDGKGVEASSKSKSIFQINAFIFGLTGIIFFSIGFTIDIYLSIEWLMGIILSNRPLLLLGNLLIIVGIEMIIFSLDYLFRNYGMSNRSIDVINTQKKQNLPKIILVRVINYAESNLVFINFIGILSLIVGLFINIYLTYKWIAGITLNNRPLLLLGSLIIIVGIQFITFYYRIKDQNLNG